MKKFFEWYFRRAFGWLFGNEGENLINPLSATSSVTDNLNKNYGEIDSPSSFFSKIFGGASFADFLSAVTNRISAEHMTGADVEAANMSYAQQEKFFNDYQSIPAQVQQSVEAGLNPALMYGRGASPASPISGSANASQPSLDPGQLLSSLTSIMFRAKEVSAEQNLKNAQAKYYSVVASQVGKDVDTYDERYEFWKQAQTKNLAEIDSKIFLNNSQALLNEQGVDESEAREVLLRYQGLIAKQDASDQKRMNQILYEVRESARDLNQATAFNATSQGLESQQRLNEAKSTFQLRFKQLEEELRKLSADAGISESEFKAFWGDKRLNELLVMSEIFENYKTEFRAFGFGGSKSSWLSKLQDSSSNVYGLPSLAQPGMW